MKHKNFTNKRLLSKFLMFRNLNKNKKHSLYHGFFLPKHWDLNNGHMENKQRGSEYRTLNLVRVSGVQMSLTEKVGGV